MPVVVALLFARSAVIGREWLLRRAARRRLSRLLDELPVVLEFMTLTLSAGEGILDALRRIARSSGGELAAELGVGGDRGQHRAARSPTPSPSCRGRSTCRRSRAASTSSSARSSAARRSPRCLRAQAQDARDDAKRVLLELAGKKEVAMLVPLVFLILPVTILFAVYPGIVVLQVGF